MVASAARPSVKTRLMSLPQQSDHFCAELRLGNIRRSSPAKQPTKLRGQQSQLTRWMKLRRCLQPLRGRPMRKRIRSLCEAEAENEEKEEEDRCANLNLACQQILKNCIF